jgi:hypothetical protein
MTTTRNENQASAFFARVSLEDCGQFVMPRLEDFPALVQADDSWEDASGVLTLNQPRLVRVTVWEDAESPKKHWEFSPVEGTVLTLRDSQHVLVTTSASYCYASALKGEVWQGELNDGTSVEFFATEAAMHRAADKANLAGLTLNNSERGPIRAVLSLPAWLYPAKK